jgi:hypothetical protein
MYITEIRFVGGPRDGHSMVREDGMFPVRVNGRGHATVNTTGGYLFDTRRIAYVWEGPVKAVPGAAEIDVDAFIRTAIVNSVRDGVAIPRPTYVSRRFDIPRTTVRRRLAAVAASIGASMYTVPSIGRKFAA